MTTESSTIDAAKALPQIRGYKLLRVIGHGGMSTVYLAEQESLGRKVAVKVMLPEALADEVSRRRFENEARTIARLDHTNIVGIYEVGRTADGLPYYAMPHLARGHLGMRITKQNGQTHDEKRVITILRALLGALDYAHVRGVVHRDVKAENVLFDEAERPLLADFGIALRKGINPRLTMTGLAVGSTAYMPPEQARGEEVDSRADLYSIGVLAWEMLNGELPFTAGDALSMAVMHAQDPIPRLPIELRHWQRFIDKAMTKNPANRFRSAQQMLEALDRIERGGFSADAVIGNGARLARAVPKGVWIGAGLVVAVLIGFGLRQGNGDGTYLRATDSNQPAVATTSGDDPIDAMLDPPPESPAQRWITAAEQQIASRNLTSPEGGNAYESTIAAWRADHSHGRMGATVTAVIDALTAEMARHLRTGDAERAREYLKHATDLAAETAPIGPPALRTLHSDAAKALQARVAADEKRHDRTDAFAAAALANEFAGDQALADALRARAEKITPAEKNAPAVAAEDGTVTATRREVTHAEYARFVAATGRAPALCRERLSLFRLVKPRDWREPGFEQGNAESVVCVSWDDANAYAKWLSRKSGQTYRLPSAAEWRALAGESNGGRVVAEWLRERTIAGSSWRGNLRSRIVDPSRGYDDVGFRLVRE